MIRFRRLLDTATDTDRAHLEQAKVLFRAAFHHEPEAIDTIAATIADPGKAAFDPVLLLSFDTRNHVNGLAYVFYYPDIKYGYLQYIASDPTQARRGIGDALFEALREFLASRGARGLFLDVPPAVAAKLDDVKRLPINKKRLKFYARHGIMEVTGSGWDAIPNPRNDHYLTTLLFDPLGKRPRLERADLKRVCRRILVTQYGFDRDDAFVKSIVDSIKIDPVVLTSIDDSPPDAAKPTHAKYIKPIKMVVTERHVIHHLKEKGYVERPVRVRSILAGIEGLPIERVEPKHFPDSHLTAVHHPALVSYLKAMSQKLDEKALIYPEVFPIRRPDRIPRDLEARAGYFCADTFTPLTKNSYIAARAAADVALTSANLLVQGERIAYALCRPPGHHAEHRIYGGFCYFNNSALASHFLSSHGKVALLDIDYHHGNGAQDIFYKRADVLTVSIHGHPSHAYPNFSGYSDELGEEAGKGYNYNIPLEPPMNDERYLEVLAKALKRIAKHDPKYLVVSLGFDIMGGDPTGAFSVTPKGMRLIGRRLAKFGKPLLIVQEGGYAIRNLRVGSHAFFDGIASAWYES